MANTGIHTGIDTKWQLWWKSTGKVTESGDERRSTKKEALQCAHIDSVDTWLTDNYKWQLWRLPVCTPSAVEGESVLIRTEHLLIRPLHECYVMDM